MAAADTERTDSGPVCLGELARAIGADLHGDPDTTVSGVAALKAAGGADVTLLTDPALRDEAGQSHAAAFVVRRLISDLERPQLVCEDPARALAMLLQRFRAAAAPAPDLGVDARAAVCSSARVDPSAWVGPFAYVGPEAQVGASSRLEPFSYVGPRAVVGAGCQLGPGAVLCNDCVLDDDVVLGPGAVVGHEGFGYYRAGPRSAPQRIPSAAGVRIGRGVEIGANSCVDRGTLAPTEVGAETKIDNLVQVGHNVRVGDRALLCAQVGLAGSARVGDDALLAGQVGVADHRRIGVGAQVGAKSGVARDVAAGERVSGYPAIAQHRWLRASALFSRLGELARELRAVKVQLQRIIVDKTANEDEPV